MYKINTNILIKILLLTSILFSQGCSKSKNDSKSSRRSPDKNPGSSSVIESANAEALKEAASIKKADSNYDAYQSYQSINAPVSLNDLKKVRRRPVLNIKELNDVMDNNSGNEHVKQVKAHSSKNAHVSKEVCTESDCDIKKVIKYNKQQAANAKPVMQANAPVEKVVAKPIAKPVAVEAVKIDKAIIEVPVTKAPVEVHPALVPVVAPAVKANVVAIKEKLPEVILPQVSSSPQKNTSTPTVVVTKDKTTSSEILKDIKDVNPQDLEKTLKAKFSDNSPKDFLKNTEAKKTNQAVTTSTNSIAPPTPVVTPVPAPIAAPVVKVPITTSTSSITPPTPVITPALAPVTVPAPLSAAPTSSAPPAAVAKLIEYDRETNLSTINGLFIKYYFNIKNKISGLFHKADD